MAVEVANILTESDVRRIVHDEVAEAFKRDPAAKRVCLIASKGSLDWTYPPLILASAAAAAGMETSIFFTFYGLNIIRRDFPEKVRVSPVGNPAMPMPIPMADSFTSLPGMKAFATAQMKAKFKKYGVASIRELISVCRDSGVRLIACTMTMEVFRLKQSDFIDGVEYGGAGAFLSEARRAHVTLFI
ncbi:MAG TPA: DsrE/DsrF/DrsH-like family protein [Candidatus Dormibacteraeota bacterium]|nr:DsrE/DsrF/DrsH-like family protein [Candidatus Dormibacteraeota bacterium]